MNKPELYGKYNSFTKAGAIHFLDQYAGKMKWRKYNESVIDLGCGDGSVSTIIKRYFPTDDVKFLATDISDKMIEYAKEKYSKENIAFRVLDMQGDLSDDLKSSFNHVFSFYTIQFVKYQEKAFRNIYDLLAEGGDCFLCFLKHMPIYDLFIPSSQEDKWKPWIPDVNKFVSPYSPMQNSEERITGILKHIGFADIHVECVKMKYVMTNGNEFKSLMKSIEPFDMPSEVFEEFARDNVPRAKKLGILAETCNSFEEHDKCINYNYQVLIVYASKPKREFC